MRCLQRALVILVLKQMLQFRSFGKWLKILRLPGTTLVHGSECISREASRRSGTLSPPRFSLNSCSHSGRSCDKFPRTSSLSSFLFGFSISAGPCDEFPRTSTLVLSLLSVAGSFVWVTVSCDEDVGEVGEGELEELVYRLGGRRAGNVKCNMWHEDASEMTQERGDNKTLSKMGWLLIGLRIHSSNTLIEEARRSWKRLQRRLTEAACCQMDDTYFSREWSHFTEVASFTVIVRRVPLPQTWSTIFVIPRYAIYQSRMDVEDVDPHFVVAALCAWCQACGGLWRHHAYESATRSRIPVVS